MPLAIPVGEWRRCSSCPQGCCRPARGLKSHLPQAPKGQPGALRGHPWAPKASPLGAQSTAPGHPYPTCCHQSCRCAEDHIDRRGPQPDGWMPQAKKLPPCQPHLINCLLALETQSNLNLRLLITVLHSRFCNRVIIVLIFLTKKKTMIFL